MEAIFTLVRTVLTVAIILTIAFRIFRILRPFERGLVERFGKYNREASPGLNIVIPVSYTHLTLPTIYSV